MDMKILITEKQLSRLIETEDPYELPKTYMVGKTKKYYPRTQIHASDIEFVENYYFKTGHLPTFSELRKEAGVVGDYNPNHPYPNVKLSTYMDKFLGKNLETIRKSLMDKYNIVAPSKKRGLFGGSKTYLTIDGKHTLRSLFEVITYNIFLMEGKENEIEIDTRKFNKMCDNLIKEPDFVWNNKIVIEIAGLEDQNYLDKLERAKKCFNENGYEYIIINSRNYEQRGKYIQYYLEFCKQLGFNINEELLKTPELLLLKLLGYKNMDKEFMQKYIDDNIRKPVQSTNRGTQHTLYAYIKFLHGMTVGEYKEKIGLSKEVSLEDFSTFMNENPNATTEDVANHFNITYVKAKKLMKNYL